MTVTLVYDIFYNKNPTFFIKKKKNKETNQKRLNNSIYKIYISFFYKKTQHIIRITKDFVL